MKERSQFFKNQDKPLQYTLPKKYFLIFDKNMTPLH